MKKPGKRVYMAVSVMEVTGIIGGTVGYQVLNTKAEVNPTESQNTDVETENTTQGFSEEGTTQMRTVSQCPEFSVSSVRLEVEEVYVEAGDTVTAGDALYKIADESMAEVIAYYEDIVADAKDALEMAEISYESGKQEAEYEKQEASMEADLAQSQLDAALLELDEEVQEKLDAWEEAKEDISTYTYNLENNMYYRWVEIDEKKEIVSLAEAEANAVRAEYETVKTVYEEAKSALENDIMAFTNSCETEEWTEETIEALKSLSVTISNDYKSIHEAEAALEEKQTTYSNAEAKLKQAKQTLEQAESEYKKNTQEAESKLEELNNNIGILQSAYEEAVNNSLTEKVDLQNDYDTAALNGEYASTVYDNNVTTLEEAVTEAKKNLEELQKEQEEILALEDGVIRAAQDGTIATVTYEVGNILNTDALVTYCDTSVLTISVEVSQEDIAKIAVGDIVAVSVSGSRKGNLEGSITSIASSATTGGSISNVTYAVVITIDNADGKISSGSSASVTFLTEKEMETESNAETETSMETNEMKEMLDLNE